MILRYNVLSGTDRHREHQRCSRQRHAGGHPESGYDAGWPLHRVCRQHQRHAWSRQCVCVWDAQSGATTLASADLSNNVPANAALRLAEAVIRRAASCSSRAPAANLVTNSLAGDYHVYVRDTAGRRDDAGGCGYQWRGRGAEPATAPQMTPDGRFVVFECPDAGLVAERPQPG